MRICNIGGCNKKHWCKGLCRKHYNKQYRQINAVKIAKQKKLYEQVNTEKINKHRKLYRQINKERINKRRRLYFQTLKGKTVQRMIDYRRRQLGYTPLNDPFPGCEGHHIDREQVIYMPAEIHNYTYHSVNKNINMEKMNRSAFKFLDKQD